MQSSELNISEKTFVLPIDLGSTSNPGDYIESISEEELISIGKAKCKEVRECFWDFFSENEIGSLDEILLSLKGKKYQPDIRNRIRKFEMLLSHIELLGTF